jgi:hypothetical protein
MYFVYYRTVRVDVLMPTPGENYNGVDNETGGGQTLSLEYVLFLSRSSNAKMILWPFSEENSYVTLTDEIGATSMDYGAYIS